MLWINTRNGGLGLALVLLTVVACTSDDDSCGGHSCTDGAASSRDAGAAFDAGAADGGAADARTKAAQVGSRVPLEPAQCSSADDCTLPDSLLACHSCDDGSEHCPKAECVDGHCATAVQVCPERQPVPACTSDADCRSPGCDLLCQGDGRSACLPPRCRDGACIETRGTCDIRPSSCPSGSRTAVLCGECGDAGSCEFEVIGCFGTCGDDSECPFQQPCRDGVCVPAPSCS